MIFYVFVSNRLVLYFELNKHLQLSFILTSGIKHDSVLLSMPNKNLYFSSVEKQNQKKKNPQISHCMLTQNMHVFHGHFLLP